MPRPSSSIALNTPIGFTPDPSTLSYADVAKVIKRRLQRYSLRSIIYIGVNHLTQQHQNKKESLEAMPWLPALVIKLAIEDKMIHLDKGDPCPTEEFYACCNAIWKAKLGSYKNEQEVLLRVRATMHAQLIFQSPETFGFLRWAALISRLDATNPCRSRFESVFCMTPDDFMLAAILLMSQLKTAAPQQPLDLRVYSALPEELTKPLYQLVKLFSKDLSELRVLLQGELHSRREKDKFNCRPESERFEFPWLAKYPLLKLDETRVLAWNPTIFYHGLEESVHIRMSEFSQDYTDSFSKVFEDYVIELIKESGTHPITDKEFKRLGNSSMSAVDALIPSAGGNVFIESKMSLFPDDVLLSDHPQLVKSKLKRIREAIVQGWKVGTLLRSNEIDLSEAKSADNDYLIVVTSRQLLFGNGLQLKQWVDEQFFDQILLDSKFMSPSKEQLSRMPPQNITIISIEEFEQLVGAVKSGNVTYLSFVKQLAKNAINPATATMVAEQVIEKYVEKFYVSEMLNSAKERVLARAETMFNS